MFKKKSSFGSLRKRRGYTGVGKTIRGVEIFTEGQRKGGRVQIIQKDWILEKEGEGESDLASKYESLVKT